MKREIERERKRGRRRKAREHQTVRRARVNVSEDWKRVGRESNKIRMLKYVPEFQRLFMF